MYHDYVVRESITIDKGVNFIFNNLFEKDSFEQWSKKGFGSDFIIDGNLTKDGILTFKTDGYIVDCKITQLINNALITLEQIEDGILNGEKETYKFKVTCDGRTEFEVSYYFNNGDYFDYTKKMAVDVVKAVKEYIEK